MDVLLTNMYPQGHLFELHLHIMKYLFSQCLLINNIVSCFAHSEVSWDAAWEFQ